VAHTRPSGVAVLAQGVAAVAKCAAAGSAGHRRPLASRSVRSALVAAFAASGKTTHRFAGSRPDSALGRRKPSLGCAAHPRRVPEAGNCRLGRTVSRYLHGQPRTPSQTWRTFLANHLAQVAYMSELPSPDESG